MLCRVCCEGLQGIWNTSDTKRVCRVDEFLMANAIVDDGLHPGHPSHFMFAHHPTLESFQQSVREGCSICHRFKHMGESHSKGTILGYYSLFNVRFTQDKVFMSICTGKNYGGLELCPYNSESLNLNLSSNTGDETTWNFVKGRLENCVHDHRRCNQQAMYLPPRLLQLDRVTNTFRLIDGNEHNFQTRYATLCHAYNGDDFQLTKSTLASFYKPQALSELPLTYRDAFVIVVRLNLSHLWIDKLCVLQDDEFDQISNKNEVNQIFSQAFIGIGVTSSLSPHSGLFASRDPRLITPTVLDFPINLTDTTPYISTAEEKGISIRKFRKEPLVLSAKAFHERLLSPRMIHFSQELVYWECYGAICDEISPKGRLTPPGFSLGLEGEQGLSIDSPLKFSWKPLINVDYRVKEDSIDQGFIRWSRLIEEYSRCTTSSSSEKLQHIQHVVDNMKGLLQRQGCEDTTYLAGMWKLMLPGGLVWSMSHPGKRSMVWRAPSWSWASVDGFVNFHVDCPNDLSNEIFCRLVSLGTSPIPSTAGGLHSAITLRGKLVLGKLAVPRKNFGMKCSILSYQTRDGDSVDKTSCDFVTFDTEEGYIDEVFCFPILGRVFTDGSYFFNGLALSQMSDGSYFRRGIWEFGMYQKDDALNFFEKLPIEQEITII